MNVGGRIRKRLVTRVQIRILLTWHRIISITLRLRKLVHDAGLLVLLSGEILELRHARVELIVRIIDYRRRLIDRSIVRFVLEFEGSVRQFSETIIEIGINRTGIDHLAEWNVFFYLPVITIQHDLDIRVIKHVLEHARKAVQRHRLVRICKVTIVTIRPRGNARSHARVELRWIKSPLLARVVAEEFFVQLSSHFADDHVLRRAYAIDRLSHLLKKLFDLERCQIQAVKRVDSVQINRNRNNLSVYTRLDAMLVRPPFRKPRKVFKNLA